MKIKKIWSKYITRHSNRGEIVIKSVSNVTRPIYQQVSELVVDNCGYS